MKALALSSAAEANLATSGNTAPRSRLDQADRHTDEIRDACRDLAAGIRCGRPVDVHTGYLNCATAAHMVYFLDKGDRLDIIRILHQKLDIARNLP